jgi:hypothetical protein
MTAAAEGKSVLGFTTFEWGEILLNDATKIIRL